MRTTTTTHHIATATAACLLTTLAVGALAGCTPDEPEPTTSPGVSIPTRTVTPTPTPAVTMPTPAPSPTLPVEWIDDGIAGAEESVRYFLELYNYTVSSQDTARWQQISHSDCVFCSGLMADVASDIAAGKVVRPAPIVVQSAAVEVLDPGAAYQVDVDLTTGPDQTFSSGGVLLDESQVTQGSAVFVVLRDTSGWILREVDLSEHT